MMLHNGICQGDSQLNLFFLKFKIIKTMIKVKYYFMILQAVDLYIPNVFKLLKANISNFSIKIHHSFSDYMLLSAMKNRLPSKLN